MALCNLILKQIESEIESAKCQFNYAETDDEIDASIERLNYVEAKRLKILSKIDEPSRVKIS